MCGFRLAGFHDPMTIHNNVGVAIMRDKNLQEERKNG